MKKNSHQSGGLVKMADVARDAGVSMMTVSNSFNRPAKVMPETRKRVLAAAQRLGYIPNSIAGTLASGNSKVVAVVTPSIRNSDFSGMISSLEMSLRRNGFHLIISVIEDLEHELKAVKALVGRRVDGIVLTGSVRADETRSLLKKAEIPTVETWSLSGPFIDMGVGFSAYQASMEATQLMLQKGLVRIGAVGPDVRRNPRFRERLEGFQAAMRTSGQCSDLVAVAPDASGFSGGTHGLDELLQREPELQGVFCFTDVLAAGILFECMRRRWAVPDRLSVVGFGDYEIAAEIPPGLTTVHTPGGKIGEAAADMIIARIQGRHLPQRKLDVGFRIVIRGTA